MTHFAPTLRVWFDGGCSLCMREIAFMRRLDKARTISFIDATLPNSVCPLNSGDLLKRFHAEENGALLSGAAAFAAMWRAVPLLRPLGLAARNQTFLAALERLYLLFLRHRPTFQRVANWLDQKAR
jgi:predicted DCC family thiol-disulfide oxidoreductase YuxK